MNFNHCLSGVFYSEAPTNVVVLPLPKREGWEWVEPWVNHRFSSPLTRERYMAAWRFLQRFFAEMNIQSVADLTRDHCFGFMSWRKGVKPNTARHNLVFLRVVCNEAIARGLIASNPASKLGIARQPVKEKPELSDAVMDEILTRIGRMRRGANKDFYRLSFSIARYHGARLAETRLPLARVDLAANTITFHMKGSRTHVVPIHPNLRPVLEQMIADGKKWTFEHPSKPSCMSQLWWRFFSRTGLKERVPGITFHCLRVSCITRLARANISQTKAMRFVNHSSAAVHSVYTRVQLSDLNDCLL